MTFTSTPRFARPASPSRALHHSVRRVSGNPKFLYWNVLIKEKTGAPSPKRLSTMFKGEVEREGAVISRSPNSYGGQILCRSLGRDHDRAVPDVERRTFNILQAVLYFFRRIIGNVHTRGSFDVCILRCNPSVHSSRRTRCDKRKSTQFTKALTWQDIPTGTALSTNMTSSSRCLSDNLMAFDSANGAAGQYVFQERCHSKKQSIPRTLRMLSGYNDFPSSLTPSFLTHLTRSKLAVLEATLTENTQT